MHKYLLEAENSGVSIHTQEPLGPRSVLILSPDLSPKLQRRAGLFPDKRIIPLLPVVFSRKPFFLIQDWRDYVRIISIS